MPAIARESEGGLVKNKPFGQTERPDMRYVYMLRSQEHPDQTYIGVTENIKARFEKHNSGGSPHTSQYRPWDLVVFIRFGDDSRATAFERYLKTGSGRAFAAKHLW